jgi:hypothetical protein
LHILAVIVILQSLSICPALNREFPASVRDWSSR